MLGRNPKRRSLSRPAVITGRLMYYLLIGISIMLLILPVVVIVFVAFNPTRQEVFPPTGISLRWFWEFLMHDAFFQAFFVVSLPIALIAATISTIIGGIAAYFIVRYDPPLSNSLQTLLLTPLIIPAVIIGLSLLIFFARYGVRSTYVNLVIGHVIITLPFPFLTSLASLYTVDFDVEKAARNLGANRYQAFYRVTLPLMKSGVIAGFLFAFIISFSDAYVALFLTSGQVITIPIEIFTFLAWESSPIIAAISTVQIVMILVIVLAIGKLIGFKAVVER